MDYNKILEPVAARLASDPSSALLGPPEQVHSIIKELLIKGFKFGLADDKEQVEMLKRRFNQN